MCVYVCMCVLYKLFFQQQNKNRKKIKIEGIVCAMSPRTLSLLNFYEHSNKSPKLFHVSTVKNVFFFMYIFFPYFLFSFLTLFNTKLWVVFLFIYFMCPVFSYLFFVPVENALKRRGLHSCKILSSSILHLIIHYDSSTDNNGFR